MEALAQCIDLDAPCIISAQVISAPWGTAQAPWPW